MVDVQPEQQPPTILERWVAGGLLSVSLLAGLGGIMLFLWWIYEAATLDKVRGYQGHWVSRANDPGVFWVGVGTDVVLAAILTAAMAWALKRLSQKGEWAKATDLVVSRWR